MSLREGTQHYVASSFKHIVPHGPAATGNIKNRDSEPFYNRGFAFEAPVFRYGKFEVMELTKVRAGRGPYQLG